MKPLPYTRPRVGQILRQGWWFTPAVLGLLVALELVGRQTANDWHDTFGSIALLVLGLMVAARHRTAPLGWLDRLGRLGKRVLNWTDRFKVDLGLDLRGAPPIPRRMPAGVFTTLVGLVIWTAAFATIWYFFPEGWRGVIHVSYVLYLAFITLFWGVLLLAMAGGIYIPLMLLTRLFPSALGGSKLGRPQLLTAVGYLTLILLANHFLPLWIVPVLCGVVLAVLLGARLLPAQTGVQFIWRPKDSRRVYSVPAGRLLNTTAVVFTLFILALIITAAGGPIFGRMDAAATMPITLGLGVLVAWLTPGVILAATVWFFLVWRQSPGRPCKPVVHGSGDTAQAIRGRLKRLFRAAGWDTRFEPDPPRPTDVRIRLVEPAQSEAREFDPVWPLRVSLEDLEEGEVRQRLERRDELQKRRLFLKGLERLMKAAHQREFSGGTGFWLAPHLWLLAGMTRDDIEESDGDETSLLVRSVGPPYHQVFPRAVRHYLYHLLRALEVDLIFVEDGINHRKLGRVMRVLFEVYDKFAGRRRAEEIQFQGMPKVRVLIHDFQLDQPFESNTYPEPRFEDLGRARILHIFRDRGDQEEFVEPPADSSRTPTPLWMN
jgi:hypothetical protein